MSLKVKITCEVELSVEDISRIQANAPVSESVKAAVYNAAYESIKSPPYRIQTAAHAPTLPSSTPPTSKPQFAALTALGTTNVSAFAPRSNSFAPRPGSAAGTTTVVEHDETATDATIHGPVVGTTNNTSMIGSGTRSHSTFGGTFRSFRGGFGSGQTPPIGDTHGSSFYRVSSSHTSLRSTPMIVSLPATAGSTTVKPETTPTPSADLPPEALPQIHINVMTVDHSRIDSLSINTPLTTSVLNFKHLIQEKNLDYNVDSQCLFIGGGVGAVGYNTISRRVPAINRDLDKRSLQSVYENISLRQTRATDVI